MLANTPPPRKKKLVTTRDLVVCAMMIALTVVLFQTPLGRITLPMISITIAHVPILVAAILFGLGHGLVVALAFGCISLWIALTAPVSALDPFFVNPLISILPRLMIPVTTWLVYRGLRKLLGAVRGGNIVSAAAALAAGNLTNTFGIYTMLYIVYARQIFEATGKPALELIVTLISTTTLIKCLFIVVVCTPLVCGLQKALKHL